MASENTICVGISSVLFRVFSHFFSADTLRLIVLMTLSLLTMISGFVVLAGMLTPSYENEIWPVMTSSSFAFKKMLSSGVRSKLWMLRVGMGLALVIFIWLGGDGMFLCFVVGFGVGLVVTGSIFEMRGVILVACSEVRVGPFSHCERNESE